MRMYAYVSPDSVAPLCNPKSDICHVQLECQCILSRYNAVQISVIFSCFEKSFLRVFFVRFGLFPIDLPILYAQYVMLLWIGILSIVVRIECLSFCLQEQLTDTDEGFEISVIHKTRMKQFLFFRPTFVILFFFSGICLCKSLEMDEKRGKRETA